MKPHYQENFMPDLFSWSELELMINMASFLNPSNCVIDPKEAGKLQWDMPSWNVNKEEMPVGLFEELMNKVGVFYFVDCSRFKKEFNDFASHLEEKEKIPFDTHVYVHYKNLQKPHPFGCHWDLHSNVIIQCEGSTHWMVYPKINPVTKTQQSHLHIDEDPIIDIVLNPGDAIWIPRYYPHHAISKEKRISLSFAGTHHSSLETQNYKDRTWISLR